MRRLYLQVYVAFLGVLAVFVALVVAMWRMGPQRVDEQQMLAGVAALVAEQLPAGEPAAVHEKALKRTGDALLLKLTLWSGDGKVLASSASPPLPFPGARRSGSGWTHSRGRTTAVLRLPDGRWLAARHVRPFDGPAHGLGLLAILGVLGIAVGVGAYPVARRLTRRLERLRAGVEELGRGTLSSRVPVEGRDEVADLARSFNRAADRIEALVGAQRTLLASASHELRSPLARIRVALELMGADRPELREPVARDVAELDELIGELLLASRLHSVEELERAEEVDLLGLAAEEAARCGAEAGGRPVTVRGDPRLLRRLLRNLLENGVRHGGPPVEVHVDAEGGRARVRVTDGGPGVPEAERERIFAPFYRPPGAGADGGSGLGLALVRQIARRHGGEARCLPRDGGGTVFEVELPARGPSGPPPGGPPR
jgi:signal transduction histidine kinase